MTIYSSSHRGCIRVIDTKHMRVIYVSVDIAESLTLV